MSSSTNTHERNFTNALISALTLIPDVPTQQEVEAKAKEMAFIFGYVGDLRNVISEALESITTRMGIGISLIDIESKHDYDWVHKRNDYKWIYSKAYESQLLQQGWSPNLVQDLSDITIKILGHIQDPLSEGTSWNRRGLVIGHVQSGKTANYTGLIARAADSGYKFIIVIAGIHNNLRKQTQQRIDESFIGRSSDPVDRRNIGVGLSEGYPHPATLTNIYEDFNKKTAGNILLEIKDINKPIIVVIKKNVSTLASIYRWLHELNSSGDGRILDVPMLLIDDEADNASINTNKDDLDPTRTNAMIRSIIKLFAKSSFVGYTATPFANIFINPDAYDKDVHEELFPRDFIYCLDAPNTYFGAEKVFLNDESSQKYVRIINDCEEHLPFSHKRDDSILELPPSLYGAVDKFIVARAIRNLRGHANKHCSMMVNVSRFVPIQKTVRSFLSLRVNRIREAVIANFAMPEEYSSKNVYMQGLKEAFDAEYADTGISWVQVKTALKGVFENLHLFVINSKSEDTLDYVKYEREGVGLTAIAVGGLSLSRGLTIEGLTISYMYRNTKMYDTLMQMGRWFGYRHGYEDLCRVYLSTESIQWYAHIADASEELIQQVKQMLRDRLSPKDFGLYVKSHPDSLLITAANKMRAGQEIIMQQSYSGRIRESHRVSIEPNVNIKNFELIKEYWRSGFGGKPEELTSKGFIFRDVSISVIEEFLNKFTCHSSFTQERTNVVSYLELILKKYPKGDVVLISPRDKELANMPFTLTNQERAVSENQPNDNEWRLNKDRVASKGDEKIGLTESQLIEAESRARNKDGSVNISDTHYRMVRNKPLLMIHSLMPKSDLICGPIAAFGMSFPYGDYATTISVVANKVWLKQQQGYADNPDDEDDYDE